MNDYQAEQLATKARERAKLETLGAALAASLGDGWQSSLHPDRDWLAGFLTRASDGLELHLGFKRDGYGAGAKERLVVSPNLPRLDPNSSYDYTSTRLTEGIRATFDPERAPAALARSIQTRIVEPYALVLPEILKSHAATHAAREAGVATFERLSELLGQEVRECDRDELARSNQATIYRYKGEGDGRGFSSIRVRVNYGGSSTWELSPVSSGDAVRLAEVIRDWCAA